MILRKRLAALAVILATVHVTDAAELQLYPLRIELTKVHSIDAFRLSNTGQDTARLQLTLSAWDQDETGDVYTATHDILANPPLFAVAAKTTQTVRVGLGGAMCGSRELAYRAFFQEVPDATKPASGIQTLLRISVPIFIPPSNPQPAALNVALAGKPGRQVLLVSNPTNQHVQVTKLTLSAGGKRLYEHGLSLYVLAGRTVKWAVESDLVLPARITVAAETDRGRVAATAAQTAASDNAVPHKL